MALASWAGAPTRQARAAVLAAFVDATVYAAVRATATGEEVAQATGLRAESGAELAVLLLEDDQGARALPVFSDLDQLRRWQLVARPQRLTGAQACAAAIDEQAGQVVLDVTGAALVLEPDEVRALAEGWVPVPGSSLAVREGAAPQETAPGASPELVEGLRRALQGEPVRAARLLQGEEGLVLGVCPRRPLDPAALAALAQRLVERLGQAMPAEGLGLTQVPARGPGQPVLRGRFRRTG